MKKIAVLLSTYNGDEFIDEQIDSILKQELAPDVTISIFVRDDGSREDKSKYLREHYFGNTVNVTFGANVGVKNSFFELMRTTTGFDYYFFSDQDDIWDSNKVMKFLEGFRIYEENKREPVGIYSDLWVADEFGKSTGLTMKKNWVSETNRTVQQEFHSQNMLNMRFVTGASFAINESARNQAVAMGREVFDAVHMHDEALALQLILQDGLYYINEPLVFYRQHGNNVVGVAKEEQNRIRRVWQHSFDMEGRFELLKNTNIIATKLKSELGVQLSNNFDEIARVFSSETILPRWQAIFSLRAKLFNDFKLLKSIVLFKRVLKG